MIQMYNMSKVYSNGVRALDNLSIEIERGDFVFLIGSSGAGKSTFLKMIFREELPTEGHVIIDGRNIERLSDSKVPYLRRNIGVVFQDFKLLKSKTVYENVAFAMRVIGMKGSIVDRQTKNVLDMVGLLHKARMYPEQISGGEQQRVCIARALVNDPGILLTDEPTGNLDPDISKDIMNMLKKINLRGTTVIMATHDKNIVDTMRERVVVLKEGRIIKDTERGLYSYEVNE
ncbi:MAG: cell division ATP-binding protein FtsE [Candidatus Muiribacterium halophilum]|uniref:Cell division ATP-binding protein FtsE n=1 Tax=Muiribacterium halophilum TaxID=2053465 RepID=A0A2N5ZEN0_MUIH1|nr:MAG: cell division ATP-binding protein FtsE [Candidatus Muirbacterium halophilum]